MKSFAIIMGCTVRAVFFVFVFLYMRDGAEWNMKLLEVFGFHLGIKRHFKCEGSLVEEKSGSL